MTTDRAVHHPWFARVYARTAPSMERVVGGFRRDLLAGLSGRVLEVGAGTGANFRHYPSAVSEVVAVEPEAYLRERAVAAAAGAPVPITVIDGLAERLPVPSDAFAAAVASLVLCSVRDQRETLREIARVLEPGGALRFFEHVRADTPGLARFQAGVDRVWPLFSGGCHVDRDTVAAIERSGFVVEELRRFRLPDTRIPCPTSPIAFGRARLAAA